MKSSISVDAYIAEYPRVVQKLLKQVRMAIREAAPLAEESINYGIPTFKLGGKNLVHYAAFEKHIGFYPGPSGVTAFKKEFSKYKSAKGSVQFPLGKPLPLTLVTKVVKFRLSEAGYDLPKLSKPATSALVHAGVNSLKELSKWTEHDVLKLHGMGPGSIPALKAALKAKKLSFRKPEVRN